MRTFTPPRRSDVTEGDEPADAPPRLNHGSKVLPVKKKKSESTIDRMEEPSFYIKYPAFASSVSLLYRPKSMTH